MLMFILGFVSCFIILLFIVSFFDIEIDDILSLILFPLLWLWLFPFTFFKNCFQPITQKRFEEIKTKWDNEIKIYHIFKGLYFMKDKKASIIQKKYFLFRVKTC